VEITDALNRQDGDMVVIAPDDIRVLMHGHHHNGGGEVAWWHSNDGGSTWGKSEVVISSDRLKYHVSAFVNDAHPDGQIVLYEIDPDSEDQLRKLFLWGEHGFVQRAL